MTINKHIIVTIISLIFIISGCASIYVMQNPATISLYPDITYQTITGWEATASAGQTSPSFPYYKSKEFDLVVNDLGINRLRLEIRSGTENKVDYWTQYQQGKIDYQSWRAHRYSTVNDNSNYQSINWTGYQFSELDNTIDTIVLPIKKLVAANGEELHINLTYVAFTGQIGAGLDYIHNEPAEYAEFILAAFLHIQDKYGWVPDSVEVILEPDNTSEWRGQLIGNSIVTAANLLSANGFNPGFIVPSSKDMGASVTYFDQLIKVPGVLNFVEEFSYHRYSGVSQGNLQKIADRRVKYGVNTSMLEHIGSGYEDLHNDLKLAMNSAWQQFTLGGPATNDNGGAYYLIDDSKPTNPHVITASRTKFLRQYFKFIRRGAVRVSATTNNPNFDPLAFINKGSKYVVIVKAERGGSFNIQGLPGATYGIKYTTNSEYDHDLQDITIRNGQVLSTKIPAKGVITIYAKTLPKRSHTCEESITHGVR